MNCQKTTQLYEGKAKKVFSTTDPTVCIVSYKDDATAFNGEKRGTISGKGSINNRMSNLIFRLLESGGVKTHYIGELSERETAVRRLEIVPLEVIVRNLAAGSFSSRYGVAEGRKLACPSLEFSYKNDTLGDPLINSSHILALELATKTELEQITASALKINEILSGFFAAANIVLVDFKLEFGRCPETGEIILADEISPDTCRLWDSETGEKLDKDRFRRDLGNVEAAYSEVAARLGLK